ncbi:hypothetical protein RI129_004373 [Pyrocoelia pectoralis]|uniref:CHK kinase-like domain-containing protein n=1 Tax=Pyrocoelia pectoralis TaxID=417401 RepID=A0AAN7VGL5_9COLE
MSIEQDGRQRILRLINKLKIEANIFIDDRVLASVTNPGENWVGELYRVKATANEKGKTRIEYSLILKMAPSDLSYRRVFNATSLFHREIYFYDKIIPELMEIQRERGIKTIFQPFPKFYLSSKEYLEEAIVMDDMRAKGFIVGNHRRPVDYETALLVMKTLGKFNALSFAIREYKPEVYEEIKSNCEDNFLNSPAQYTMMGKLNLNLSKQTIATCGPGDEKIAESINKFAENLSFTFPDLAFQQEHEDYGVITHGDCQTRNFLFKYRTTSTCTIPEECCMIDTQISRIASPALDILFFVFVNTDKGLRSSHYDELIEEYYKSFSTFLRELECDPETLFPFTVLQSHLRKFAPIGFGFATWVVALNYKKPEEAPRKDELSEESLLKNFSTINDGRYFERMKDLAKDMVDYGYNFC